MSDVEQVKVAKKQVADTGNRAGEGRATAKPRSTPQRCPWRASLSDEDIREDDGTHNLEGIASPSEWDHYASPRPRNPMQLSEWLGPRDLTSDEGESESGYSDSSEGSLGSLADHLLEELRDEWPRLGEGRGGEQEQEQVKRMGRARSGEGLLARLGLR